MTSKTLNVKAIDAVAMSVRTLSMDAIQKANSGHPGLPMGCAELGGLIFGEILKHFPSDPDWANRDRFVLSAGHGSMFLYSLLHLSGYNVSREELMQFRQMGSKTAGHPEYHEIKGIETTTGPLGQGFSNAVGMAMAEKHLAKVFNTDEHKVVDHYTYVLAGDGDLMEGISYEAASLAGHLGLDKLIVFYDSNRITIEGSTDVAFSDDVAKRFESCGWHVSSGDGYDVANILKLVEEAKRASGKPSIIILNTVIAKGAVTKEGSHGAHGSPLGDEEIRAIKKKMGIGENEMFYVHPEAVEYFKSRKKVWEADFNGWKNLFEAWGNKNPGLLAKWKKYFNPGVPGVTLDPGMFKIGDKIATRSASGKVLNVLAKEMDQLIGGSADLAPSNNTNMSGLGDFQKETPEGRNLHFGIREHAMGGILNGLALHGGIRPFGATFLVFADYVRPPVRLASLMKLPVIYVFTHDSIYVGEDGPTHQPVEHLASLRIIPGVTVLRPADAQETAAAWEMAVKNITGPTILALTRQNLLVFEKPADWQKSIQSGAYIAKDSSGTPDVVVVATGSEVTMALKACEGFDSSKVRVISMISRERFVSQPSAYKEKLIPQGVKTLVVEAGVSFGWEGFAGQKGAVICIDTFGASGPGEVVAEHFGFSVENIAAKIQELL